jgi:hypothetical protein
MARSRGLGDVYKRQGLGFGVIYPSPLLNFFVIKATTIKKIC